MLNLGIENGLTFEKVFETNMISDAETRYFKSPRFWVSVDCAPLCLGATCATAQSIGSIREFYREP